MEQDQTSWVVLARILRPQGRRGEVLADLLTDFPERFSAPAAAYLAPPSFAGLPSDAAAIQVISSWLPQGKNRGRIVLGFASSQSIEDAERLSGLDVIVPETERVELTDGSVYVDDLVGCTVFDREREVGVVQDVQFMTSPDGKRKLEDSAPLLTVAMVNGEALIPFAKDFVVRLDLGKREIWMSLPAGLLDVNVLPAPEA